MILDGKKVRDTLLTFYKEKIILEKLNITLAIIRVGNDKPSELYILHIWVLFELSPA